MQPNTANQIIKAVQRARKKHPNFAKDAHHAVCLATEELGEFAKAVNEENPGQAEDEALDTIAVLVRYLEGDLLRRTKNE